MNFDKVKEIFDAWRISFNPNDAQAELAAKRIEICNICEFKTDTPIGPGLSFYRCSVCGCALKGKIYTPKTYLDQGGSCPKEKWKEVEDEYLSRNLSGTITSIE